MMTQSSPFLRKRAIIHEKYKISNPINENIFLIKASYQQQLHHRHINLKPYSRLMWITLSYPAKMNIIQPSLC